MIRHTNNCDQIEGVLDYGIFYIKFESHGIKTHTPNTPEGPNENLSKIEFML